jgi:hypothetical protein
MPVLAGARAAAALDDGSFAVLERAGRVGLVREGRVVWGRRLEAPGSILTAHPGGFLLVQDAGNLVAIASAPPDAGAAFPVTGGLARDGRPALVTPRDRCPLPPPTTLSKGTLRVDGFAASDDGLCRYPRLEVGGADAKRAGRTRFRFACDEDCRVSLGGGRVVLADARGLAEVDAKGVRKPLKTKTIGGIGALAVDGRGLVVVAADRFPEAPVGRAVLIGEELHGLTSGGRLWSATRDGTVRVRPLPPDARATAPGLAVFGMTVCVAGSGHAGCATREESFRALPLTPRVTWFGERAAPCEDASSLCLHGEGEADQPVFKASGRIDDLALPGDGSLALLANGRVITDLTPDGATRWEVVLAPPEAPCGGEAWLERVSPALLVAHACGLLVGVETGLR